MRKPLGEERQWISRTGYVGVVLLLALHIALWWRVDTLHGFWGHLDEASRWLRTILLLSLVVSICCFFGSGWKRWVGSILGFLSLMATRGYAAGL
jgi:hypothetical protein